MCTYNSTDLEIVPSDNPILCSPVILEIDKPPSEAWEIRKTNIHQFNPECVQGIYRRYNDRDQKQILNLHKVDKITNKAKSNLCWKPSFKRPNFSSFILSGKLPCLACMCLDSPATFQPKDEIVHAVSSS